LATADSSGTPVSAPPTSAPPQAAPAGPPLKLEQRVLLSFYDEPLKPLSIQEIQRALGVTYKPVYQALTNLASRSVLAEERSGWARSFRADCSSPACAREFVLLEWARGEAFIPGLPDGERERVQAFARRCEEEATPLFIRTLGAPSNGGPATRSPVQLLAVLARPEERPQVALIARETNLPVSVSNLDVVRHILLHRPDIAAPLARGVCLQGAELFVQERFRALGKQAGKAAP
jgi:hypothetical protein